MKQKLLLMLKTLFASKGFSQKALEGLADILAPNLTEESTPEEINDAIKGLEPVTSVMQAEINRQVNTAKTAKVDETKAIEPEKAPEGETAEQKSLRLIMEKLEKQDAVIAAMQGEKVVNTWKSKLEENLKESDPKFKAATLKAFGRMKFENDDQFNEYLSEVSEDAKEFVAPSFQSDRPIGSAGKPASGEKEVSPLMKGYLEQQAKKPATATA